MNTYHVIEKATGKTVYEYASDAELSLLLFPKELYTHEPHAIPAPAPAPLSDARLTRLEFLDLLGNDAYHAILAMAKVSVEAEGFVNRLAWTTPDPDGKSVSLADPRTIGGIRELEPVLISQGAVAPGWADRVLSGKVA